MEAEGHANVTMQDKVKKKTESKWRAKRERMKTAKRKCFRKEEGKGKQGTIIGRVLSCWRMYGRRLFMEACT